MSMENQERRLKVGVVGGRPTAEVWVGDERLFAVTADTEEEALAEAQRRLADFPSSTGTAGGTARAARALRLDDLPEMTDWTESSARRLLDALLLSEGHGKPASTFKVRSVPNADGDDVQYWRSGGSKGSDATTPRQRAYLAFYWLVSGSGKGFVGRGIVLDGNWLWPDKGVIRDSLSGTTPLLRLNDGIFDVTPAGRAMLAAVVAAAPWARLAATIAEVAPIAAAMEVGHG